MSQNSISAYERHAGEFLEVRDSSTVGIETVRRWASTLEREAEVIEIACGGGIPTTKTLVEARLRLWAFDASAQLIAAFEERFPEIPAACATIQDFDFFQRRFDAAIAIGLIFLLDEADQHRMIDRVSRILRPGGRFLFTAPLETGSWEDVNTGHSCVSLGQATYEAALMQAGFGRIDHCEDSGKNHYYAVVKTDAGPGARDR